jgi:5'(3')-deoxyribonucleotidase
VKRFTARVLALDVDNVLADTAGRFCILISELMGQSVTKEMIRTPKIVGSFRVDPKVIFSVLDDVWVNWRQLPTLEEDVSETIDELRSRGNRIVIATARPARSIGYVTSWLVDHGIQYDGFHHVGHEGSKAEIHANILVDDDQQQVATFALSEPQNRAGYVYDQPWNRSMLPIDNVSRIRRLRELL